MPLKVSKYNKQTFIKYFHVLCPVLGALHSLSHLSAHKPASQGLLSLSYLQGGEMKIGGVGLTSKSFDPTVGLAGPRAQAVAMAPTSPSETHLRKPLVCN